MGTGSYVTSFGAQWLVYRRTQLDSYAGTTYSRERLERCLGAPLELLRGKTVLEAGSGAGRFTEWLIRYSGRLVSVDASAAVAANHANCAALGRYTLVQADINALPFPEGSFDVVLCLGVIQHTPCPETTMAALAGYVKAGGLLVIDHYGHRSRLNRLGKRLTLASPLRAILRRVARRRPDLALRATRTITAICDPIRRRTYRRRWLDRIAGRIFPSACNYSQYRQVPSEILYMWNELDTHDMLTDWFKHRRSREEIRGTLEALGLIIERCEYFGDCVEGRARRPVDVDDRPQPQEH